jgi:predicted kinase
VYFDVPLEVCRARNLRRERVVPDEAMERMAAKLTAPDVAEGFTKVTAVNR